MSASTPNVKAALNMDADNVPTARDRYILNDEHEVIISTSIEEWAQFFENDKRRRVAQTIRRGIVISTVFLGFDDRLGDAEASGRPIVFETMIFGGPHNNYREGACTWDETLIEHKNACLLALTDEDEHCNCCETQLQSVPQDAYHLHVDALSGETLVLCTECLRKIEHESHDKH